MGCSGGISSPALEAALGTARHSQVGLLVYGDPTVAWCALIGAEGGTSAHQSWLSTCGSQAVLTEGICGLLTFSSSVLFTFLP